MKENLTQKNLEYTENTFYVKMLQQKNISKLRHSVFYINISVNEWVCYWKTEGKHVHRGASLLKMLVVIINAHVRFSK